MRSITLIAATLIALGLAPFSAWGHALLDRAEPRVGNTVATSPRELKLWFTQKIEQAFSTVTVTDTSGQRVDTGKPRVDGNAMSVTLRTLAPGTYRVNWRVLSMDSHSTEGNFTFAIGR
jgi:copper resistance protein C